MILCLSAFFIANVFAQKVARVTISAKASITEVLDNCKEAGKKKGYGSKDYDVANGKVTLWKTVGVIDPFDFIAQGSATFKDGTTTFVIRIPNNKKAIANYKKELKIIVKHLKLPEMMVGEYTNDIE